MKIRTDFVSNSSSSSFIIAGDETSIFVKYNLTKQDFIDAIEDLSGTMMTDEGKKAWSDVLNAKVSEIYNGYYGIQIQCSNVDHQRLSDFSYALAGYCSGKDYDKWFKDIEDEGQNMTPVNDTESYIDEIEISEMKEVKKEDYEIDAIAKQHKARPS